MERGFFDEPLSILIRVGHTIQFKQPMAESVRYIYLSTAHLACILVVGNNGLCPLAACRRSDPDD